MSLRGKLAVVQRAEADCAVKRAEIGASWHGFKEQSGLAATPRRIVVAGLVAGFLAGLPRLAKGSGSLLGGKLVEMLVEGAFANLGALIAGAAAADEAASAATEPGSPSASGPG